MFQSKKKKDRDLAVPSEVVKDKQATEILRAWVANGGLVCTLRPETWNDPSSWGIVLADVARHIANAVKELNGDDSTTTIAAIRTVFNNELADPSEEATGRFEP